MRKFFVAAALAVVAIFGAGTTSDAAFRITINATGAGSPAYFYESSSNSAAFAGINVGNFTAVIQTGSSNYPGTSIIGSLSQTVILANSGAGGNFDVLVELINSVVGIVDGQVTDATQITNLNASTLLVFTAPIGNPLTLSSDVSTATNLTADSTGSAFNRTTANATTLDSLTTGLNPAQSERITFTQFDGTSGYTLSNHLMISSVNSGATGITVTGVSGVTAVPAPAGLILFATAAPFLGLGWFRRRKMQPKSV